MDTRAHAEDGGTGTTGRALGGSVRFSFSFFALECQRVPILAYNSAFFLCDTTKKPASYCIGAAAPDRRPRILDITRKQGHYASTCFDTDEDHRTHRNTRQHTHTHFLLFWIEMSDY